MISSVFGDESAFRFRLQLPINSPDASHDRMNCSSIAIQPGLAAHSQFSTPSPFKTESVLTHRQ